MKILQLHNKYQIRGGEDGVVEREKELLEKNGHLVLCYLRDNNEIKDFSLKDKIKYFWKVSWSKESYESVKKYIQKFRPDVAHFHNLFPLITPSAYYACIDGGVPVVQTLHNYRYICPGAQLLRKRRVCEKCINHNLFYASLHRCYRNSIFQTYAVVRMLKFHRKIDTWATKVNAFIALTNFSKYKFIEGGLPSNKLFVKPNFFPCTEKPIEKEGSFCIFLGRLSEEKGVITLIKSYKQLQLQKGKILPLKIVGDGPQKTNLEKIVKNESIMNIEFVGNLSSKKVFSYLRDSAFVILPSIWYEGFPLVVVEAFAHGKPVIASRIGSLGEIVTDGQTGLHFEPGKFEYLSDKIKYLSNNKLQRVIMGRNARKEFEQIYSSKRNYDLLMEIYCSAIKNFKMRNDS